VKGPRRPIRNWLTKQRGSPAYLAERRSEVPTGTLGEIQIRGHNVMNGYWNLPQAIAAAIIDGWFATGDIGCVDEDGYFFVANHNQTPFGAGQHRPWHSRQKGRRRSTLLRKRHPNNSRRFVTRGRRTSPDRSRGRRRGCA
jgi:acyl-CoA synthetase (AMP-forming)/AMP-acid ligase II